MNKLTIKYMLKKMINWKSFKKKLLYKIIILKNW